jgi:hypothetical protein
MVGGVKAVILLLALMLGDGCASTAESKRALLMEVVREILRE